MMSIEKAKALLEEGYTCAMYKETQVLKSAQRGVAPLLEWLESDENFHGFSAVDKVVGKAAAFLYVLLGVKQVFAFVLSEEAEKVLTKYGILVEYEQKVPMIRNRTNTGFCPMEQAVWEIDDPAQAQEMIKKKRKELQN